MAGLADLFLDAYATIERYLRDQAEADRGRGFKPNLIAVAAVQRHVKQYEADLLEFHDLRNAIVHERRDSRAIADPRPEAVAELQEIARLLVTPPRLAPTFTHAVQCCTPSDPIKDAAGRMHEGNFSQLPVIEDGEIVALLTSETIARWLAATLGHDFRPDARVAEVLPFTEDPERHWRPIARTATLADAVDAFHEATDDGYSLDSLIITRSGLPSQRAEGIITTFDIPRLQAGIRIRSR